MCNCISSHRSSVGRAGDCNGNNAEIPRSVVRVCPVRYLVGWPSGLRRWFKAPVSSDARVRISPQSSLFKCKQSGAVEACWAHNPKVGGSKPPSATFFWRFGIEPQRYLIGLGSIQVSLWPSGLRRAPAKCVPPGSTGSNPTGDEAKWRSGSALGS